MTSSTLQRELGGDPRDLSHTLDASDPRAKTSAKRVHEAIYGADAGDAGFEPLCDTTPIEELQRRGTQNGLTAFLSDVAAKLGHPA